VYRTGTQKATSSVLAGAGCVMALDTVINLFQGDFIVTVIHGVVTAAIFGGASTIGGK